MSQRLGQKLYSGSRTAPKTPSPDGNGERYEKPPALMAERSLKARVCFGCSTGCPCFTVCEFGKEWNRRHPC